MAALTAHFVGAFELASVTASTSNDAFGGRRSDFVGRELASYSAALEAAARPFEAGGVEEVGRGRAWGRGGGGEREEEEEDGREGEEEESCLFEVVSGIAV